MTINTLTEQSDVTLLLYYKTTADTDQQSLKGKTHPTIRCSSHTRCQHQLEMHTTYLLETEENTANRSSKGNTHTSSSSSRQYLPTTDICSTNCLFLPAMRSTEWVCRLLFLSFLSGYISLASGATNQRADTSTPWMCLLPFGDDIPRGFQMPDSKWGAGENLGLSESHSTAVTSKMVNYSIHVN